MICGGRFEADDDFAWLGVAEAFAGESFNGFRVTLEGVDGRSQFAGDFFLFLFFGFEAHDFFSHAFVLADEREVPSSDGKHQCHDEEEDYDLSQPSPNTDSHFHCAELTMRTGATEAGNQRMNVLQVLSVPSGPMVTSASWLEP